jgi:adenosine deaminase
MADKYRNDYPCAVVGVDIAAGEEHFDREQFPEMYQLHYDMCQRAKDLGLSITLHAGETPDGNSLDNVRRAINDYGATRIGHGYRLVESVELMQEVKAKGVHLEVCPTSSVETGGWIYETKNWKEHPACSFLKHGLSFSINSDDPAVFHTSLSWQYRLVLAKMEFTREQVRFWCVSSRLVTLRNFALTNKHCLSFTFCSLFKQI